MAGMSEYELLRERNIKEREALFSSLFKELKEIGEPLRKSAQSRATNSSQRRTPAKQRHSYSVTSPTVRRRRSVRIRRLRRLKGRKGGCVCDDDDDDNDDESNEDDCGDDDRLEELSDEEARLPRRRVKRRSTNVSIVLSPEEVTEEDIRNVAQSSTRKTYSSERGTCCHQCRQKTLDTKTICRSGICVGVRGQFCGPCLKNRYGESAEKALKDPDWACPPCRGLCNCSICRTREGKKPTGILFPFVQSEGYSSVKEYLQCEED